MLKLRLTTGDGDPLILLGITAKNVEKLIAGEPMVVRLAEMGIPGNIEVAIVYGQDEQAIAAELRRSGLEVPELPVPRPGEAFRVTGDGPTFRA